MGSSLYSHPSPESTDSMTPTKVTINRIILGIDTESAYFLNGWSEEFQSFSLGGKNSPEQAWLGEFVKSIGGIPSGVKGDHISYSPTVPMPFNLFLQAL